MPAQTTNYQCPACTGPLSFDGSIGKLKCDFCDSIYEVAEIEALYAEKDAKAAAEHAKQEEKRTPVPPTDVAGGAQQVDFAEPETAWHTENLNSDWGADGEHMRAYNCTSCGAELICDDTTAATSCLYCGNPTIVPGQFAGALKPDYVIPFKLSKDDAKDALKKHCKGKRLLPKVFLSEHHIEELKGAYVPFWLFDGSVYADVSFKAQNATTVRSGDYITTTTRHYDVRRAGTVEFSDIPVDSSSKMPDEYMESIEPFDYKDMKPFSAAYMPGFFADKYDVEIDACSVRADQRAIASALGIMRGGVSGYSSCKEISKQTHITRGDVRYAMAPVWMLTTKWRGKTFLFAINGQTGKLVGELPCDYGRFAGLTAIVTAVATVVGSLGYFFLTM